MKSKLLFAIFFLCTVHLFAKEGMWLPFLLEKMNEKEMKSMGMKISAKDIYDVNNGSLKDAVVLFGGGCTGEVISDKGLVLTNHHCGYGTVQGLSSLENNYLLKGFFAKNQSEEIPCPGLTVTFIVRIDDVTAAVKAGTDNNMPTSEKNKIVQKNIERIEKQTEKNTGYTTQIKSFYYDNEYYLFLMEKYTDVRLVGFPPNGIGKFGGDTDNWAWPRHTGDFGLFRIYANQENKPASYNKNNIPYKPRKSFSISIKGPKENDFTMVYGFPGRTSEYLTSDGVAEIMNVIDPARIKIREERLNIMNADMRASEEVFIKYASKQASIANYYKKWKGELLGLQINHAVEKKKKQEAEINEWINKNELRRNKYAQILPNISQMHKTYESDIKLSEYINEIIWASELIKKGEIYTRMLASIDSLKSKDSLQKFSKEMAAFYKSINKSTDLKIAKALYKFYESDIIASHYTNEKNLESIYENSFISSQEKFDKLLQVEDLSDIVTLIKQDDAYITYHYFDSLQKKNIVSLKERNLKLNEHYGTYLLLLKEYNEGKKMYPDANSTLRLTYGKVEGVKPQDGMLYTPFTTLDGAVKKHNPNSSEYTLPEKLLTLHQQKNYGQYAINYEDHQTVPLAFLASNHTTGGNSGSPVLNAKGELIGTNFDRIWEGTMSDILFDSNLCRNITLDIRYTLFIIEKFGDAKWVIDELRIVK